MNPTAIFWPMIAHVLLVYIVYAVTLRRRKAAIVAGSARVSHFRDRSGEPPESASASNNVMNQFELPVLFHVVCLCLFATNGVSFATVALAWLFAVSRYAHAWFHLTENRVRNRFAAFAVGFFALGVLWVYFALHLLGPI